MRHAIVLITSLLALLAFSSGTRAQNAGTVTPAVTPAPSVNAFEIGPEPGADPATTATVTVGSDGCEVAVAAGSPAGSPRRAGR